MSAPLPRFAWLTVGLLWPVALLNYLDRQMLSTMGISIKADIVELQSAEMYGNLMAVFMWVYAVCSPLGGIIADRVSKRWLIITSLAVWSFVTLMMGHVHGYRALYGLRAVMGVSEAFYIPAGLALIADYHRGATRSLAVGIHMSGIYLGQALGGLGGWVAQEISWRAAFQGCGVIGVAYAFVLIALLRERDKADAADGSDTSDLSDKPSALAQPNWAGFIVLMLCFSLPSLPGWAVKNWLPTLLQDRFLMEQKTSGLWATVVVASAGFLGVLIGGRLSDRLSQENVRGRTWVSATGLVLIVPALAGIGLAPSFWVVIACTAVFGIAFGLFDTNNMPILCQLMPPRLRATGYGLLNLAGIGSGAFLTPLLGRLKDQGVPLAYGFACCAVPALIAAALMLSLRPASRDCGTPG
ncbi:MAG: MFS transporter [Verrucomicrobiaceae bacterium]|nr:MFS transporter [Verrucomicrobiaceae bacterium]